MLRFGQVLTNFTHLLRWTERSDDSHGKIAPAQDDHQDQDANAEVCENLGTHQASPSRSSSSRSSCSFQSHEASTSGSTPVDFWRVQLEAIYRKRNPYKLQRVPDLLENWKGQEALLYRRVCLAYDLDAHQFYACQTKWPEDADGTGSAHVTHVCVSNHGSFSSAQDQEEDEQAQERSAKRSRKAPFAFCCSNSDTPVRRALGNGAKKQVLMTPAGISPFAQQSQGSEKWCPVDPEADELAQGNRSHSRCVAQGQDDSGIKTRVLAPRNALSELLIRGQHPRMNQLPNALPPRFDAADGILSFDVPIVGGRPLLGGRRVLPADEWPAKRRKTTLPAVSAASTANH
mmetsp:Transcript_62856/g.137721  ORF Transcript_62856/g.137721 Transcript_62856/m.137721 type:complete len:345 (+) Transcript_62856:29-1063(+)